MSDQTLDWRPPVGTRVTIKRPHPWHGHSGTVKEHQSWMGKPSMNVQLDVGTRAGVTSRFQFRLED